MMVELRGVFGSQYSAVHTSLHHYHVSLKEICTLQHHLKIGAYDVQPLGEHGVVFSYGFRKHTARFAEKDSVKGFGMSEGCPAVALPYAYMDLPDILPLAFMPVEVLKILVQIYDIRKVYKLIKIFKVVIKTCGAATEFPCYTSYGEGLNSLCVYYLKGLVYIVASVEILKVSFSCCCGLHIKGLL